MQATFDRRTDSERVLCDFDAGRYFARPGAVHPLLYLACNPCLPTADFGSPWREGSLVYATDGATIAVQHVDSIEREALALVDPWTPRRPPAIRKTIDGLGPFLATAYKAQGAGLPRPLCVMCAGAGLFRLLDAATHCPVCQGTGRRPFEGYPYQVAPGVVLDAWTATMLASYRVDVSPPFERHGAARWSIPDGNVWGYCMPRRPGSIR